ncbi:MAG: hypothetical protein IPN60_07990 [Saprospiraceae bacterium]|nr:hypothetical protein [Candidatus Opimibacter skivensis]
MKNTICLYFLMAFASLVSAQSTLMPAQTKAAIQVIQRDLSANRNLVSREVIDLYPIYNIKGQNMIAVLCKVNSSFRKADAIRDGFDVGAIIGTIASMRMPLDRLQEAFTYPGIEYLEVAEKIAPELDGALVDTRANLVHAGVDLPQPFTGKNVLIGIVDWGFDYTSDVL